MQPGQFAPRGEDWLVREVQTLRRELNELRAANPFGAMGVKPMPDGLVVEGYETVNGPLEVNGDANFNGAMSITGTLSLPAGIIDNDALTNPVVLSTAGLSQNNFAVPTSDSVYAQATVTVPDGYTRADVLCMVVAGAANGSGATDYLYVSSSINGVRGGETPQVAGNTNYASAAANGIRSLTGLSGGVITVGCNVRAGTASWGTNAANFANTNAFIYFRR